MLDFAIKLNNTKYLTCLEKSSLWKKLSEIATDSRSFSKSRKSFEKMFLYLLSDWKTMQSYDHFGRPSIFTKLLKQVLDKCPPSLKIELDPETAQKLEAEQTSQQVSVADPNEIKRVTIPNGNESEVRDYFEDLLQVTFSCDIGAAKLGIQPEIGSVIRSTSHGVGKCFSRPTGTDATYVARQPDDIRDARRYQ